MTLALQRPNLLRADQVVQHMLPGLRTGQLSLVPQGVSADASPQEKKNTLTVIDNRTGKKIEMPIKNNTVESLKFFDLQGLRLYDPGFMNTCSATSRICEIQGGKGILRYRGYPIEQLAEKSTFLEVSYLLVYGELPTSEQLKYFSSRVSRHTYVHEDLKHMISSFRYDAHPMGSVTAKRSEQLEDNRSRFIFAHLIRC